MFLKKAKLANLALERPTWQLCATHTTTVSRTQSARRVRPRRCAKASCAHASHMGTGSTRKTHTHTLKAHISKIGQARSVSACERVCGCVGVCVCECECVRGGRGDGEGGREEGDRVCDCVSRQAGGRCTAPRSWPGQSRTYAHTLPAYDTKHLHDSAHIDNNQTAAKKNLASALSA